MIFIIYETRAELKGNEEATTAYGTTESISFQSANNNEAEHRENI